MYQYVALYGKKYEAVFGADATTISTIQSSYVDFFKALKLPDLDKSRDPDQRTRIAAVREWLRRRTEWLLIFDNLQEKDYNEWKSFLPGGDTGHILVTTRSEWAAATFTSGSESLCIHLDKLDPASAPNLLLKAALLEKEKDGLMDLATVIVERLWYIPLTIEFVGRGNQSEEKLRSLLNVLADRKLRESLEEKYSQDTGVLAYKSDPTTFLTLYTFEKLTPKTQEIWRVMAFMDPSWYSEYLFHTIRTGDGLPLGYLVSDPQELAAAFEELLGGGIIQRMEGQDGYWTHDLIHEISRVFLRTKDKESEYASFAASWLCAAFPEYRNFGKWDREKAYLKHAEVCVGFADELHLTHAGLQRLLYKASNFARFIGNYRTAERLARRGVDLFKDTDPEVRDVRDLFAAQDSLALALRRQSQYSEATYILEKNLEEETQMLGAKDKDTLNTLNEIGWGMFLAGDAEGAELVLREAMQKRVEVLTESAGPTQHTFQNLAACLTKLHKYKEAEELYRKAEAGHIKLFTEDHHWVQHIRGNIAQLYEADGRLEEAMDVYRGVYNWRRNNSNFGDDHPDTLRIAANLARAYFKLDRREDAASLARRTRVRFERVFGNDHPETKELDILIWEIEKGGQA
jgi:tetratricopeptide (TPR) repeat protein